MRILILLSLIFLLACSGGQDSTEYREAFDLTSPEIPGERITMEEAQPEAVFDDYLVTAQQGSAIVEWNPKTRRVRYVKKCSCGHVTSGSTSTVLSPGSVYRSSFHCPKCKQTQKIAISCSK